MDIVGETIGGRYRVEKRLGQGGMASVYRVVDVPTGDRLALKLMTEASRGSALRFRREFHTMAGLAHPRVVGVFDYGVDRRGAFYTMELLDGEDLRAAGRTEPDRACAVLRDVASALAFVHTRRLVHRDVSPRNVRCTSDGHAKLIDFGILSTFGISSEIAGTPPFAAPETVRGLPIDHRADIYGLGALAYWLLTGNHAFGARTFAELEQRWSHRPPHVSEVGECPETLDRLVMSMLSLDPLARPSSAAEVIDRLTAVAGLEPLADAELSRGYLASAALVGRDKEMTRLRDAVARTKKRKGRAVLIEAPSGTGKSRLLRELALEAQLSELLVVRADARAARRVPYAVVGLIVDALWRAAPDELQHIPDESASLLARVFPIIPAPSARAAQPGDPGEQRARLQAAIIDWVTDVARRRELAILVDDFQVCDEASASVLAALAYAAGQEPYLIALSRRTDEDVTAPAQLAAVRDTASRIRLRGLENEAIAELVAALFGDVPHSSKLVAWLARVAGGSPLHCLELIRHLVDSGSISFAEGAWMVADDLDSESLPVALGQAMELRVESLSAGGRGLAETLSVFGAAFSLEDCIVVSGDRDESSVFSSLDELVREEIVVGANQRFRFRHDGLREALLRRLERDRETELHLRVGRALADRGASGAEVGWHLLRGGEAAAGAKLLERAGLELFEAQSFADAIPVLEAVVEVYEGTAGTAPLELSRMLVVSGTMADRETLMRHASAAIAGYAHYAGVNAARRIGRVLGRHIGFFLGFGFASLRWLVTWPLSRSPNPVAAMRTFFFLVGYVASAHVSALDRRAAARLLELIESVTVSKKRVPYTPYLVVRAIVAVSVGRLRSARADIRRALQIFETDRLTPVSDMDRRTSQGACWMILALLSAVEHDPEYSKYLTELRRLGLKFFEASARQARVFFHRLRGEEDQATEQAAALDEFMIRLGNVWQIESQQPVMMTLAYAHTGDVIGLRRGIDALARLVDRGFAYGPHLELARGEYHKHRGELAQAETELRAALAHDWSENLIMPQTASAALAETLLAAGDAGGAIEHARRGVELGEDPESGSPPNLIRNRRALGLALAETGRYEQARSMLDVALEESTAKMSPVLSGGVHEAIARVALAAGNTAEFERHRQDADRWFRGTRNPVLVARAERLADLAERRSAGGDIGRIGDDIVTTASASKTPGAASVLSNCRGPAERAARALSLVVDASSADRGFLFLARESAGFELAAPASGDEPPREVLDAIEPAVEAAESGDLITVADKAGSSRDWHAVVLRPSSTAGIVGIAVVCVGAVTLQPIGNDLLEDIAGAFVSAGDVTAMTRSL